MRFIFEAFDIIVGYFSFLSELRRNYLELTYSGALSLVDVATGVLDNIYSLETGNLPD